MSAALALLSTTVDGRWHPSIGDPSLVGWITVIAYLATALLAGRNARAGARQAAWWRAQAHSAAQAAETRSLSRFWWCVACLLLALGVNKQLDLQTLFTQVLRDLARAQGWYERRRPYQVAFIAAVGLTSAAGTALLAFAMRRVLHRIWLGLLGLGLLAGFVLIRAASIHQVDVLLKRGTVRLNWVLELGAIGVIALSALRARQREGAFAAALAHAPLDARAPRPAAAPQLPDRDGNT
jgi:hypothetical protein